MRLMLLVAVLLASGCGKGDKAKEKETPPVGSAGPGSGTSGPGWEAISGTGSGSAVVMTPDDRCAQPCLMLKEADLARTHAACPDWSLGKHPAACDEIDFTRNCIYAAYGYTFKKDRWKKAFGDLAWYKPDPAFKESAMSPAAVANVGELKQLAAACRDHNENQITPETRAIVDAWFAKRNKGQVPPLPDEVTDLEGNKITKAEFAKQYLADKRLFVKDKWEPIEWIEKRGKAVVVGVSTGVPDPATCEGAGEDCEGFESIEFAIEKGVITAISTFAAACPFVYEPATGGGWAYRGEILRNLVDPAREATRTLALAGTTCTATRTIRITEEKRERTYLDAVALEVDGVTVAPDACGAVCADDGRYHELAQGDALDLTFTLSAPSCAPGTVIANGYYVPL